VVIAGDIPYMTPPGELTFGDIFSADYLYDTCLSSDAAALTLVRVRGNQAVNSARRLESRLNKPVTLTEGGDYEFYTAQVTSDMDFVLAHGRPRLAILVNDDCAIDDALGRGGKHRRIGRLLFAAVSEVGADELGMVANNEPFDRFALPATPGMLNFPAVVELRSTFMVQADVVSGEDRLFSLAPAWADRLEATWSAYATRHGPLVAEQNAEKLAALLVNDANRGSEAAIAIAQTIADSWGVESDLAAADGATAANSAAIAERVAASLDLLGASARAAAAALRSLVPK
jgi:hypothetical protein